MLLASLSSMAAFATSEMPPTQYPSPAVRAKKKTPPIPGKAANDICEPHITMVLTIATELNKKP